jgi:Phosphate-selective porin O and P
MKKIGVHCAVLGTLLACSQAQAVNWLMVQGTEVEGTAPRAKLWGFIQPQYESKQDNKLAAGGFSGQDAAFNMVGPNLESSSQFQLRRARIGVRGTGFPLDNKVNYFLLAELGKNGITEYGAAVELTDASVTFNHIKGARVRVGEFKTPMSEEVYQGIALFDWINFTGYANQQLLERFVASDGQATCNTANHPAGATNTAYANICNSGNEWTGFGAARDIGIQVFDSFKVGSNKDWELSYSFMLGNGNGLNQGDNNKDKDYYLYLSAEQVYGGKRARRQGWKTYAWYTKGVRTILNSTDLSKGIETKQDFDRERWGLGTTYRKGKIRAAAEYNKAKGMIFNGTFGAATPGSVTNNGFVVSQFTMLPDEEADGWYLDVGYKVLPKLELAVRYDEYNRATKVDANERNFTNWTFGTQYFFNKKTRVALNYQIPTGEASNLPGTANANRILDKMGNVISVQVTAIF